jgi:AcrR family transcriptional regulator
MTVMPPVPTRATQSASRYRKLPNGRHGLPKEAVIEDQRARIFGAMVEQVTTEGYAATTIKDMAALAGVSRRTFYNMFPDKETCFLWVFDVIIRSAMQRVSDAYRGESDWGRQLHSGFRVFIQEVVERPDAAQLALVDALGAGPTVLEKMESASAAFEHMVSSSFAASPSGVALPRLIAKGIVGGLARVVRQRLLDDQAQELTAAAEELFDWMIAYHSPSGGKLRFRPPARAVQLPTRGPDPDERLQMMHNAAAVAAQGGYSKLGVYAIVRDLRISVDAFADAFPGGVEECFLSAYDLLGAEVAACTAHAARATTGDWPERVHASIGACFLRIACDPVFAQIAFVEVFSVGPAGIARRSTLMQTFTDLLTREAPRDARPSHVVAEAIVGSVWQLAHHVIWRGQGRRLPELADFATYLVLAPILGGETAIQHINT